ncbi:hypothetical protein WS9_007530 [Paraclostridium sordellii 8483]|uniref:hypothetical protein n=1 Tax=Paraclostridium sordellii TaxID=1505 RepID=UPI000319D9D6|nr:hypothetical protein [Paeniclostridium sordellii]TAN67683.1 hypothetical protein WS9_007530 [Paeniclostridium sordellii 8483]
MKKFLIAIPILFSTLLVGCGVKEVDISKYLKVEDVGVDRLGKSYACLDDSFFLDSDIFGKNPIPDNVKDSYKVEVIESPNEDLKNGDEVKLSLKYNEKLYEDNLKVKLSLSETKHKVSGLEKKYLTISDLTNSEYIKLRSETEKIAKEYMTSTMKLHTSLDPPKYDNFKFISAYILNPFDFNSSSDEIVYPSILYLYKVNAQYNTFKGSNLVTLEPISEAKKDVNYIFVEVSDFTFNNSKLNKFKIHPINDSLVYPSDISTDIVLNDYLNKFISNNKEHLEKINIKEE